MAPKETMNIPWLFLKWFFQFRGSTRVHPAMALGYIPSVVGIPIKSNEAIVYTKLGKFYREMECAVCGCTYWSMKPKNPSPVCTLWSCYRKYYGKEKVNQQGS